MKKTFLTPVIPTLPLRSNYVISFVASHSYASDQVCFKSD